MFQEKSFIVIKIWINNGYEEAKKSIDESLKKLQTSYVDLLLIHHPFKEDYETYRAMEEAYKLGKAKAIGLSNYFKDRFTSISRFFEVKPAVNQVETHVFQQQKGLHKFIKQNKAQIMLWHPFVE